MKYNIGTGVRLLLRGYGNIFRAGLAESRGYARRLPATSYTFQLRRDVKFSDSTAFNADSVKTAKDRFRSSPFRVEFWKYAG